MNIKQNFWRMPYVYVNNKTILHFLKRQDKNKSILMAFRSWDLAEYPVLPEAQKQTWDIKTSSQLEKLRYVILAFQTKRKNHANKNSSEFDYCHILDIKLFLNSKNYRYENLNVDIKNNQFALLYNMYTQF